jgi:hypothetical protein
MTTETTTIISLSCIIGMIYLTRLIIYLKTRRSKPLKPKASLTYRKEDFVPVSFLKDVYSPTVEYNNIEPIQKEWVNMKKTINLN